MTHINGNMDLIHELSKYDGAAAIRITGGYEVRKVKKVTFNQKDFMVEIEIEDE